MYEKFLGNRITQLRMQHGLSEIQLSNNIGANDNYINQIVLGKTLPSMKRFFQICEYFEITPLEFFDDSEYGAPIREACEKMNRMDSKDLLSILNIIDTIDGKK